MKIIALNKTKDFQIGNVRVSESLFNKIKKIAKDNDISMQTVVRAILENSIDEVTFK